MEETQKETTEEEVVEVTATPAATEENTNTEMPYVSKLENLENLRPGMTIRVHETIKDVNSRGEERERIQIFEGMILAMRGNGISRTMTIRKISKGFGVEKIYPINSPIISKIELVKTAKVRRANLSYVKNVKRRFKRKLKETWK